MHRLIFTTIITVCSSYFSFADVKPNGMFTDNAVLQRGINVPVWGTAYDDEKVTVSMNGQSVSTVLKMENGKFICRPCRKVVLTK